MVLLTSYNSCIWQIDEICLEQLIRNIKKSEWAWVIIKRLKRVIQNKCLSISLVANSKLMFNRIIMNSVPFHSVISIHMCDLHQLNTFYFCAITLIEQTKRYFALINPKWVSVRFNSLVMIVMAKCIELPLHTSYTCTFFKANEWKMYFFFLEIFRHWDAIQRKKYFLFRSFLFHWEWV